MSNKGKKYKLRDKVAASAKVARCGHVTLIGRYFKCEECLPELPEDQGDLIYCESFDDEPEETYDEDRMVSLEEEEW